MNKEISFSARDNGVESTMSRLRRSAKEMSNDLLKESSRGASSQSEVLRGYEEQVRLIQKRNQIDAEGRKMVARERLDRVMNSPHASEDQRSKAQEAYSSTMKQINVDSKADNMQVRLLQEIADTLKLEARADAEGNLRDADGNIIPIGGGSGGAGGRGGAGGSGGSYRDSDGRGRSDGASIARQMDVAGYIMGVQSLLSSSTMASAITSAGGAMMAMGGNVGKVGKLAQMVGMVGEVTNLVQNARADMHKNMFEFSAMSGKSAEQMDREDIGDNAFLRGFTRDEYLSSILPSAAKARGSNEEAERVANRVMTMSRGTGLDNETLFQLEKISGRQMMRGAGGTSTDLVSRLLASGQSGEYKSSDGRLDFSRLSDSMQEFISLQQTMFMRSGSQTSMTNALLMSGRLGKLGGSYQDDQYKWSTIQALDKGITSQSSPETTAIKMGILRKAMPSASYAEMMEEMEKGLDSKHLLGGIQDFVNQTGGDNNSRAILFQQLMGNQMRWSDVNNMTSEENLGIMSSKFSTAPRDYYKEVIGKRATKSVSDSVQQQIRDTEYWQDMKSEVIGEVVDKVSESLDGLSNAMGSWMTEEGTIRRDYSEWAMDFGKRMSDYFGF